MPIEIKTKITNEERVGIRVIKNPEFGRSDLRREILRRVEAVKLNHS